MVLAASDQLLEAFVAGFWKVSSEPVYLAIGAWPLDTRRGPTGRPVFFGRMSCMHISVIAKQFKLMLRHCAHLVKDSVQLRLGAFVLELMLFAIRILHTAGPGKTSKGTAQFVTLSRAVARKHPGLK